MFPGELAELLVLPAAAYQGTYAYRRCRDTDAYLLVPWTR